METIQDLITQSQSDIINGVSTTIPFNNSDLCTALDANIDDALDFATGLINNQYKEGFDLLSDSLSGMNFTTSGLDGAFDSINGILDALGNGLTLATPDLGSIASCLGFNSNFTYDINFSGLGSLPGFSFNLSDLIMKVLDAALGAGFSAVIAAINSLKGLLDLSMLDGLLGLIGCFAGCDSAAAKASNLGIEKSLNDVGLNIDGSVNLSNLIVSDEISNKLIAVSDVKGTLDNALKGLSSII